MTVLGTVGTSTLALIGAAALFLLALRLSAFFSGCETGFYRASFLRLSIDAQAGDRTAQRLLWFARNPSYFVATTLVGNNVANYLATFAIGLAAVTLYPLRAGWVEIIGTLLVSPVVFVFGELLPKNLHYRAPLYLLRRSLKWFVFFYRLFLMVSLPLIWITKLFERFGRPSEKQMELVLGRSRLVQVLSHGHREGLLTDVQSRLIHGLLHTAARPVTESMIPAGRILGVTDTADLTEVLAHAKQFGMAKVPVRRVEGTNESNPLAPRAARLAERVDHNQWFGYLRAVDVAVCRQPLKALVRPMPRIAASSSKLEALLALRQAGEAFGVVYRDDQVVGILSEHGLVEQLFRPPQPLGGWPPVPT